MVEAAERGLAGGSSSDGTWTEPSAWKGDSGQAVDIYEIFLRGRERHKRIEEGKKPDRTVGIGISKSAFELDTKVKATTLGNLQRLQTK